MQEIGHYDEKNREIAEYKDSLPVEARYRKMQERMDELNSEKPGKYDGKLFAGVCVDFAVLSTALLRECGFLSELQTGFAARGKKASEAQLHSASSTLLPYNDTFVRATVDCTPGRRNIGINLRISLPSLPENPTLEEFFKKGPEAFEEEAKKATQKKQSELLEEVRADIRELTAEESSEEEISFRKITDREKLHFLESFLLYFRYSPEKRCTFNRKFRKIS